MKAENRAYSLQKLQKHIFRAGFFLSIETETPCITVINTACARQEIKKYNQCISFVFSDYLRFQNIIDTKN